MMGIFRFGKQDDIFLWKLIRRKFLLSLVLQIPPLSVIVLPFEMQAWEGTYDISACAKSLPQLHSYVL